MYIIRTAEEMARALDSQLDPQLERILQTHLNHIAEPLGDWDLQDLGEFLIVQAGDTLAEAEAAFGRPLVGEGAATFAILPEYVERHGDYIEAVFILSDDGFGLVLMVQVDPTTDPRLRAACQQHLPPNDNGQSA